MKAVNQIHVPIVAVKQGPYCRGSWRFTKANSSPWVSKMQPAASPTAQPAEGLRWFGFSGIAIVEFVFGQFDEIVGHGDALLVDG